MNNLDQTIQNSIVSKAQLALDYQMVPYDIWGTVAHVVMLYQCQIIDKQKAVKIIDALIKIQKDYVDGNFEIDPKLGAQLTLETKIMEKAGREAGLSVHTARSRNDQVMTTEMLYLREKLLQLALNVNRVIKTLLDLAKENTETVMPGYTHMQPAKPTTFAHWCLAYCDGLLRGVNNLQGTYKQYDICPLGAVESYGTSWPIDRRFTSQLLGFSKVWEIPQDAVSSRGFFQLAILSAFNQIILVVSKMATDLLLFTTFEFDMVDFGDEVAQRLHPITGSSVMPQKKNPDALELVRATASQITGFHQIVSTTLASLSTGYNRDSREVKEYVSLGIEKTETALFTIGKTLTTLVINEKRMLELVKTNYSLTTDLADYLSQKSAKPYRLIYKVIGQVVDSLINKGKPLVEISVKDINAIGKLYGVHFKLSNKDLKEILVPQKAVKKRKHIGGTNAEVTKSLIEGRVKKMRKLNGWFKKKQKEIAEAKMKTWRLVRSILI